MIRIVFFGPALIALFAATTSVFADDWLRWRGPNGNAVSREAGFPTSWSKSDNVIWKTPIPGEGFSSPIVGNGRVVLTSAFDNGKRRAVHSLDSQTGKILWTKEIEDRQPERTSAMTGHAAPTAVADEKRVFAFFGNAGVVAFDLDGKQLWHKKLGEFETDLGLASSPILHRDTLILVCDHDGNRFTSFDSFMIALDVETGKERWKTERRGLERSWSTPILVPAGDRHELIIHAQDDMRGYDPDTGKLLWQTEGGTGWITPSPVFAHGFIFATSGKNGPVFAVRPGGTGKVKPLWLHENVGPYVCSPIVVGDYLWILHEQGILTCYEATTGKQLYRERLPGKFIASPVSADGNLFCTNEDGLTYVVKTGPTFTLIGKNALEEYTLASPALAEKRIFLRTEKQLYCLGK